METVRKGKENCSELAGGSSYRESTVHFDAFKPFIHTCTISIFIENALRFENG